MLGATALVRRYGALTLGPSNMMSHFSMRPAVGVNLATGI